MSKKEKPPDDYFKCIKIPIKNVLKHYDINLPKITDAVLMCNKICGGAHYKMKMIVVVKDKASYKKWMAQKNKETFKMKYFPAAEETATPKDSLINKPLI